MPALFAEIEALQQLVVLVEIVLFQVVEQLASAARHGEQTAARMKVLAVGAEVFGQVIDPSAQESDLDIA